MRTPFQKCLATFAGEWRRVNEGIAIPRRWSELLESLKTFPDSKP
jgi:hypothetical protein